MNTTTILFVDRSIIYYLGLENMLHEKIDSMIYVHENKLVSSTKKKQSKISIICYHILDNTPDETLKKNLSKLKRWYPKAKTVACLNSLTKTSLGIALNANFDGYFLAEDSTDDITSFINIIQTVGTGMSKNMARKYLSLMQQNKTKLKGLKSYDKPRIEI